MSVLTLLNGTMAYAGPAGGQVVAGGATITTNDLSTVIRQATDKAIINWNSFSIGANESVRFIQPGAAAIALNRVTGTELSAILGELRANGNIFLVNPNGILFGAGSTVDVAGLMATTFGISDADFLAGKYAFEQNASGLASVVNQGRITVGENGFVYLVAPGVSNSGLIVAKAGQVALASGTGATLDFSGEGLVKFKVSGTVSETVKDADGKPLAALVSNEGAIRNAGGHVLLTGDAARGVVTSVVSNSGVIEATSLAGLSGRAELVARSAGDVINSGVIDVSSAQSGATAGSVLLSGENVAQLGTVTADALGKGDAGSLDIRARDIVAVGADSVTTANAGQAGDGGSILVIGEKTALVATGATLAARGGALSGDGGFVETSGYQNLSVGASADVSAANGAAGTWLIDPYNITIVAGAGNTGINNSNPFASTADGAQLGVNLITAALAGGSNVAVTTGAGGSGLGDITLAAALTYTGVASSLTLNAHNSIYINAAINSTNALNLALNANNAAGGGAPSGSGSVNVNAAINTGGGSFSATGAGFTNVATGTINTGSGAITIDTGSIALGGTLATTGSASLKAGSGNITGSGFGHVAASTLSLETTQAGATIGAENNALKVDAGTLNAKANDGHIVITDTAGGVSVGLIDTGGDKGENDATRVILTTEGGSITQAAGAGNGIKAWAANLVSSQAIGASGNAVKTDVHFLAASTNDGGIHIANQNAVEQLLLGKILAREGGVTPIASASGNVVLGLDSGGGDGAAGTHDVSISTVGDLFLTESVTAPDQLTLTASAGSEGKGDIFNVPEAGATLMARGVTINAGGNIGLADKALNLVTETLTATTTGGGIYATESNGLVIGTLSAAAGADADHKNNVAVTVVNGDIRLGAITAADGAVTLNSQQGAIIDNNGATVNVTASTATLTASKAIGASGASNAIGTNVSSLSLSSATAGQGIYAQQATALDSLLVRTNNGAVNVGLPSGGSLAFNSGSGALTLTNNSSAPALDFTNTGGKIVLGGLNVGAKSLRLEALSTITQTGSTPVVAGSATLLGSSLGASGTPLLLNADTLDLTASNGGIYASRSGSADLVLTASAKSSTAANGAVSVASQGGDLLVKSVTATGAVTLSTSGDLLAHPDNESGAYAITGASANLTAGGSIGTSSEALATSVAGAIMATANAGGINLNNNGDVSLLNATATGGGIRIFNQGNLTLGQALAQNNAVVINVSGAITDGNGAANNITGSSLEITAGSIGSSSDKIETDVGSLAATTTDGGIYLENSRVGDLDLTSAKAVGGNVDISSQGTILLGNVEAAGASVALTSLAGAIRDARVALSAPNVKAKLLEISAAQGIGTANSELVFDVGVLSSSGGNGDVAASNLSPVSVTAGSLVGKGSKGVTIKAPSIYILDNNGGVITMDANGALVLIATKGNIVFLNPNDTIIAPGGNITFQATYEDTVLPGNSGVIVAGNLSTVGGSQAGNITLTAASHITIGKLDAGYNRGNVSVISNKGLIIDGNGAATNIIGKNVTLKGMTPSAYIAELIRDMAIADYTGKVAEAGADATTVASLSAMRDVYAQALVQAQLLEAILLNLRNSAQSSYNTENNKLAIYQGIYDGLVAARNVAQIALNVIKIPTGGAQAIPFSGDGGASVGEAIAELALSAADLAMFMYELSTVTPQADLVADLANALDVARANYFTGQTNTSNTNSSLKATIAALDVAQAALTAAEHARDASYQVRAQAVAAYNLSASGSIIGTESQPLGVEAARVDIVGLNKSSVYLESPGNLGLGDITAAGEGAKVVATAAQNIAVLGTVNSPTSIALTATNGAVIGTSAGKLVADNLVIKAATGIGDLTAAAPSGVLAAFNLAESGAVNTQVQTLAATGGTGGARFVNTNGSTSLVVGEIDSVSGIRAAGDILVETTGDLKLGKEITDTDTDNAASTVTLTAGTAGSGAIVDDNGASTNVTGGTLVATAVDSISLDTAVARLTAASTGAGDISIREADAIELTSVNTADGAITVTAGGSIDAVNVVSATDSAANGIQISATAGDILVRTLTAGVTETDISLSAVAGAINDDNDNATRITGNALTLTAANGIGVNGPADVTRSLDTAVNDLTARVTSAGAVNLTDDDNLNVLLVEAADGNVTLRSAAGDLNVTSITASGAGNTVTLAAAGAITDAADDDASNITAANLALSAGTGIGASGNALETTVDKLEAASATGGIYVTDLTGDLTIGGVTPGLGLPALSGVRATTSGDIVVKAADSLIINETVGTADGDVKLTAANSSITGASSITHVTGKDFNATAATGIGTSGTRLETAVDTLTAAVTATGDIYINEADSVELTDVRTNEGSITLTAATGDITVVSVDSGATGDVTLTAATGAINDDNDNDTKITGQLLKLTAATGIGVIGDAETRSLDTAVATLEAAVTTAGVINIAEDDDLDVTSVTTPDGNVTLTSATGSLHVKTIAANGAGNTVTLAAGDKITDANDDDTVNITAANLAIGAAKGIGSDANAFETQVDNLEASVLEGGVYLTDLTGDLTIGGVTPNLHYGNLSGIEAVAGDIVVKAAGSLIINETVEATDGDVNLTATAGSITGASITHVIGKDLTATAATGIDLATTIDTATLEVTGAGNINIVESDGLELTDLKTADGSITVLSDTGDITVVKVAAGGANGDVSLEATAGAIHDDNDNATRITGKNLVLAAANGIGATGAAGTRALDTSVDTINATVTAAGDLNILETDAVELTDVKTADGAITVAAGGTITARNVVSQTDADANDISLTATNGGSIVIDVVNAGPANGDVFLTANTGSGTIGTTPAGLVTGDVLTATAAAGIDLATTINKATLEVTGAGDIDITETNGLELTDVKTANGAIAVVSATGDITVAKVAAGGATGNIALTATTGRINDDNVNSTKITGQLLKLTAANGIGVTGNAGTRSLDTAVATLEAAVTTAGVINIAEDDDLNVTSVTTPNGNVTLTSATGSLHVKTIAANGAGNTVTLAAGDKITDANNNGTVNITAANLAIGAVNGVGSASNAIETQVDKLEAAALSGGVYLTDLTGDLTIGGVTPNLNHGELDGIAVTSGDIVVKAAGSLVINEGLKADDGDVKLTAATGSITGAPSITHVAGRDLNAVAATGVDLNTAIGSATLDVTGAGAIRIKEQNAIELTDVKTADGSITVTAAGTITAKSVVSTTDSDANDISLTATAGNLIVDRVAAGAGVAGDVTLVASGAINQRSPSDAAIDIVADQLSLQAGSGIGVGAGGPLDLAVNGLSATTANGDIRLVEQNDIVLKTVSAANGDVSITSGGAIADDNDNATKVTAKGLTLVAANGIGATGAAGTRAIDTSVDSLTAATTTGSINIAEENGLRVVSAATPAGDITINVAAGNLEVDTVSATAADATVTLAASAGSIRDARNDATANVTADNLVLTAATGVGQASNALDVAASRITATGGTGGVYLNNLTADVTLDGLDATGGDIVVQTTGSLTIDSDVTNTGGGDVSIKAGDSVAQNADINVSGKGDVTVTAANDIIMDDNVVTTAGKGSVNYSAGGELAVNQIKTDSNRVSGGSVSLTGDTITHNHPGQVAITGAFLNVNASNADVTLVKDLVGNAVQSTGVLINDRLVGGEIAYNASFYNSVMIQTERGLSVFGVVLSQLGNMNFDGSAFAFDSFQTGGADGVWQFTTTR